MASNRIVPTNGFVVVVAQSSKGNEWIRLAPMDADGVHEDAAQGYLVPANKLDEVKALRESLRGMYITLTAHIEKLEAATVAPAPAQAAPDTRVDALAAKVDALTEAMTALAQIVAKQTGPAVLAPAPAAPAKNGAAKAAPAPANPLADLPF